MHLLSTLVFCACALSVLVEGRPSSTLDLSIRSPFGLPCIAGFFCEDDDKKKKKPKPKPPQPAKLLRKPRDEEHRVWHNRLLARKTLFYNPGPGPIHGRACPSLKQKGDDKNCFDLRREQPLLKKGKKHVAQATCAHKDKTGYVHFNFDIWYI
jgi:hypothetical protein